MSKLESFERRQTGWLGLWWHPEYNGYSSAAIQLSEPRKFKGQVRVYMRKNAFFNGGENGRPNYQFCLKDAKSETFQEIEVEEAEEDKKAFSYSELQALVNRVACAAGGDSCYGMYCVSDFIDW